MREAGTSYQMLTSSCKQIINKLGDSFRSLAVYCRVAKCPLHKVPSFFSFRLKLSETSYPTVTIESPSRTVIYLLGFVVLNYG